ncbi:hypothetical protein F485_gp279 [Aeromonas phage CC2]|uniref:Lipoprotein n=1 Tax=Aeromonas phage CC2 TaxID=1204516 RepID=I6XGX5_9CAUD|nr:hypothetical protein F485_gp279 [Aeromonas phage CC2]AFN39316.1 hypothetical protein CC2_016 [Aeromonas phage CC2]
MKHVLIALVALFVLVGCKKEVSEVSFVDTVTVTKFVKKHSDSQRVSVTTSEGIEMNNRVVSQNGTNCLGCYAKAGDKLEITVKKTTYEDGSVHYSFKKSEMKTALKLNRRNNYAN